MNEVLIRINWIRFLPRSTSISSIYFNRIFCSNKVVSWFRIQCYGPAVRIPIKQDCQDSFWDLSLWRRKFVTRKMREIAAHHWDRYNLPCAPAPNELRMSPFWDSAERTATRWPQVNQPKNLTDLWDQSQMAEPDFPDEFRTEPAENFHRRTSENCNRIRASSERCVILRYPENFRKGMDLLLVDWTIDSVVRKFCYDSHFCVTFRSKLHRLPAS